MKKYINLSLVTYVAIGLAIIHMIWPSLAIDGTTIALLVVAALPGLLPYIKSLELPGGVKIEANEVKSAVEKIIGKTDTEKALEDKEATESDSITKELKPLENISDWDPSLALVGLIIEIEKRLLRAAEINSISVKSRSLNNIIRQLNTAGVLPKEIASGLHDFVAIGSRAAHGEKVDSSTAAWALEVAPKILNKIDAYYNFKRKKPNQLLNLGA